MFLNVFKHIYVGTSITLAVRGSFVLGHYVRTYLNVWNAISKPSVKNI